MKVVFLQADKQREQGLADAFVAGLKRHDVDVEKIVLKAGSDLPIEVDAVCMFGVKSRPLWQRYRKAGIQVVYFDKGYVRRGAGSEYIRVAVNAHHPTYRLMAETLPSDRLRSLHLKIRPWRKSGTRVVLAGSSAKYHAFYGLMEPTEYATRIIKRIGKWTGGREIIYRPKPSWKNAVPIDGSTFSTLPRTIEQVLRGAHALVTHGSNACFEAMVAGVPSVILGDAVARPISSTDLTEIENPRVASDAERLRLLSNLAYFQWTLPEMASGKAWEFVSGQLGTMPSDPLYAKVCRLLGRGHGQGDDHPADTLNRLFRKTYDGEGEPPTLSEDSVSIAIERRRTDDLLKLARLVDDEEPATAKFPVTIVNYLGRDYLIDGSKRVRMWSGKGREKVYAYVVRAG